MTVTSLHYNGSIVTHPDNRDTYGNRIAANLKKGLCVYGKSCLHCPVFVEYEKERQRKTGPKKIKARDCPLKGSPDCPHNIQQRAHGLTDKTYSITHKIKNQISDRGAWLYQNAENKLIFVTLTLPPLKKIITDENLQIELNQAFSRFIENCKATYGLRHYIAVREGSQHGKRYHYHVIMDIPYNDFRKLNAAWLHTLSDLCYFSKNALTTDKEARFIRSISSATRYIAKYVSKAGKEKHKTRVFFCDRETAQAVVKTLIDHTIDDFKAAGFPFQGYRYNDHVVRYSINDRILADKFFYTAVQYLFNNCRSNDKPEPGLAFFTDPAPTEA